ncbi:hypothetical protein BLJAPNOD_02567 [Ensifer sp. M14]|uniref:hypothetical protein n=1 Tax=Ensifer sp. M14 TaxID=2203782 RepID=UPI000E1D6413|nr:hypothetical protein [Ensifer sp. M14]RDL51433.1 hypothetical protein BLJAPNOD_02567 [Ensifer sp. M14]
MAPPASDWANDMIRRPTKLELMAQVVIAALTVLLISDVLDAMQGSPCSLPGSQSDCYPWGSEGPVAGRWRYDSKAAYIGTGLASIVILIAAGLTPLTVSRARVGLPLMAMGLAVSIYVSSFF